MKLFNNISLRPLQKNDATDIFNTIDSEREYLGRWLPFVAATNSVDFIQAFVDFTLSGDDKTFTIREDDKFIGLIGFKATDQESHKTEIGYWLSEKYQKRGIVTRAVKQLCKYAFDELGMNRIQIKCAAGNSSSSKIPKSLGFQREGLERAGELFPDGSFADLEIYSLLKEDIVIETERLILRRLNILDFDNLCSLLQDDSVMYAYEGAFNQEEVQDWLDRQIARYKNDGFGLYAVILKTTGEFIGQCGLTMQNYNEAQVVEIGYLLRKEFWHKGYATEAAIACKKYAFEIFDTNEVFSIIRDTNIASQKVAQRNGMVQIGQFSKHYRGFDMPHFVYSVKR